jgi:hypothetical protein
VSRWWVRSGEGMGSATTIAAEMRVCEWVLAPLALVPLLRFHADA